MGNLQKFLVVSYDDDQQQWFWATLLPQPKKLQWHLSANGVHTSLRLT